jgi:ankyrin repeat protein
LIPVLALFVGAPVHAIDLNQELVSAAASGRVERLRSLLAEGVDANAKNTSGRPALLVAAFNGNRMTARTLLSAGADANAADSTGVTALMAAAAFGRIEVVELLIAAGADLELKDQAEETALAKAKRAGHLAVVERLTRAGAIDPDTAAENSNTDPADGPAAGADTGEKAARDPAESK